MKSWQAFRLSLALLVAVSVPICLSACGNSPVASNPASSSFGTASNFQSMPQATETPLPPSKYLADTWNGIFPYQKFDNYRHGLHIIPQEQAVDDGPRYIFVWASSSPQMIDAWQTNHLSLTATYYQPFATDANPLYYGKLGHDLTWWQTNHPDWILYECDRTTVAWVSSPHYYVPLDISNPAVPQYQMNLIGPYVEQGGYFGISADLLSLNNTTGGQKGGTYGCGVWTNGHTVWVQKFSGQKIDPKWAAAAQAWVASTQQYLHSQSRALALFGNIPFGYKLGDPAQQQFISHIDAPQDEAGYTAFGKQRATDSLFNQTVGWARYIQQHGKGFLDTSLWPANATITDDMVDYSIATYLMGKEQASVLWTSPYGTEGEEHYFHQYTAKIGPPCAEMYGGPSYHGLGQYVYFRKFADALALVSTSASQTYSVTLPKPKYTSIDDGSTIYSPVTVAPQAGMVLLTTNGCS